MDIRCPAGLSGDPERTRRPFLLLRFLPLIALLLAACGGSSSGDTKDLSDPASAPVISLTADPLSISANDFTALSWSVTNATSCEASGAWSGPKALSGSDEVVGPLTQTSTFILACSGGSTTVQSVTVTVDGLPPPPAPTVSLSANPTSVSPNDSPTLTWSSTDADACEASDAWTGTRLPMGEEEVGPLTETSTFTLVCNGAGGIAGQSVTITVDAPPPSPAPTVSLTATPPQVTFNGETTLDWSSTNATSCTAAGDWTGTRNPVGSETRSSLTQTSTFILTCSGAGGEAGQSVTVTVQPPANQAPVANADSATTDQEVTRVIDVLANDTDADAGDTLTVSSVTQPANGGVVNNNTNVTYTPNPGYAGADTFSYIATDGTSASNSATVTVTVTAVPPPTGNIIRVPQDFSTIGAAINAAGSGNTVLVSPGTYSETGTINITKDLTLASTFINTGNPNDVSNTVIRGGGSNDLFIVSGGANVRIEGLTIENARKPITIDVGHGTIRNNVIRNNNSDSISFEGDSSGVAEFNTIINSGDDGIDIDGLRGPYTIRGNTVLDSDDDGMEFRMIDDYLVSGPLTYEVYENVIDGTGGDGIQLIDYPGDSENRREIHIHHNYIQNATYAGVGTMPDTETNRGSISETYPDIAFMEQVVVTNNTIINNDNGITGGDNFIVLNNIIADNRLGATHIDGNSRLDYTLFFNNDVSGVPSGVQGSNIIVDDPRLNTDGSLQNGSPAIDAGASSYTWQGENVLTITTFNGSAPDLGWMESDGTSPP